MIRSRGAFAPLITLIIAIIGMVVANTVLSAPATGAAAVVLTPVQRALIGMFQPVGQLVTGVMELGQSREEANALRVAVEQLNAEVVRLREAEIENERLRAMLEFRRRTPQFQLVAAQIVAVDPSSPVRAAWIDKGANAGFKVGMVALSPAGNLVGRLTHVTPTSARVLYIVDTSSAVNAMIQRPDSRALGLLTGLPGDRLQVRYLNQQ
ncbi:MAG: rod shape-determining protein MreC [Dehalococcoidia bacterium]|nr:rod shape-determining protein MreC [Dehalococcoidia bacterium]